jgi:hypothetical protein
MRTRTRQEASPLSGELDNLRAEPTWFSIRKIDPPDNWFVVTVLCPDCYSCVELAAPVQFAQVVWELVRVPAHQQRSTHGCPSCRCTEGRCSGSGQRVHHFIDQRWPIEIRPESGADRD